MSNSIVLNATVRADQGKGASRRLRHADKVPAIIYGGTEAAQSLELEHNKVILLANQEAFYTQILTINVDGKPVQALLKDIQRHPFKPKVLHLDFLRVDATQALHTRIPLHFINEETAPAVKEGGKLQRLAIDVEITCLPQNLPQAITVDVAKIALGETLHLSGLKLPAGVTLVELAKGADHDQAVVSVTLPRGSAEAAETDAAAAE